MPQLGRNDDGDRLSNNLLRCIPKHPLRSWIPRGNDAVEAFEDDRVVRRFNNRGIVRSNGLGLVEIDVARPGSGGFGGGPSILGFAELQTASNESFARKNGVYRGAQI